MSLRGGATGPEPVVLSTVGGSGYQGVQEDVGGGVTEEEGVKILRCGQYEIQEENFALICILISAVFYSAMGIFVKLAADEGVNPFELVFWRAIIQGSVNVAAMIYLKVYSPFGPPEVRGLVLLRGIVGGSGFCGYFLAISILPLGDAITLLSLYPIITVVVARFALGELIDRYKAVAIITCAVGAVLIAQPPALFPGSEGPAKHKDVLWLGYIGAILGSCAGGSLFVIMRRVRSRAHTLQLILSWAIFGAIFSLSLVLLTDKMRAPSAKGWKYILLMCVLGSGGHFLMNYAGRLAPAGPSALLRSSDVIFAYVWEATIFKEKVNGITIGGVVFIMVGIACVAYSKYSKQPPGQSLRPSPGRSNARRDGFDQLDGDEDEDVEVVDVLAMSDDTEDDENNAERVNILDTNDDLNDDKQTDFANTDDRSGDVKLSSAADHEQSRVDGGLPGDDDEKKISCGHDVSTASITPRGDDTVEQVGHGRELELGDTESKE